MPRATVDLEATKRFELKTCPDGFVVLQRMSFGQILERRMFSKLAVTSGKGKEFAGEMAMANRHTTEFEFRSCVVDHNLEDQGGRRLDLKNPIDFGKLDSKVGQEIESYISEMNNFEDDEENSEPGSEQV